jgi:CSLREA domain-containing protein
MGSLVRRCAFVVAGIAVVACLWLGSPLPARAAGIAVTTLADNTTADGQCSLREAITNANANAQTFADCAAGTGADTISFSVSGTIVLGAELPLIGDAAGLTIDGTGQTITISGGNSVPVAIAEGGANWTLRALTVANSGVNVAALTNGGTLIVDHTTFSNNHSTGGSAFGGAISNGGGGATLIVTGSTFSGNSAGFFGGAIDNGGGTVTVVNSTFSGNSASSDGGGIFSFGTLTLINGTRTANRTTGGTGGGLRNNGGGAVTLINTIIAGNFTGTAPSPTPDDIAGTNVDIANSHHDLIGSGGSGGLTNGTNNNIVLTAGTDPGLGALGDNGGPTQTMALLAGSPALATGDPSVCALPLPPAAPPNGAGRVDQRGFARSTTVCAIGAYEPQPGSIAATTGTPQQTTVGTAFPTNLAATVTDDQGNLLPGWSVTFAAPAASGPSGTFAGGITTATTDDSGVATAPTFTANTHAGGYSVAANLTGTGLATPASFTLTNLPGAVATLTVSGYPPSVVASFPNPFTVTAVDQYGNTVPGYTGTVRFTSTDPRAALPADYPFLAADAGAHPFSAAFGTAGAQSLTATDTATATITGTQAGIAVFTIATTTILAVAPSPAVHGTSVALTATVAAVAPTGAGIRPAAPGAPGGTVTFADGSTTLATVALVGGTATLSTSGLAVGVHHLSATYNPSVPGPDAASAGPAEETIIAAPLASIAVTPANGTLKVGQAQQFTATGTYADSSTADLTGAVAWTSDAPGVVGVDATGNGTGEGAGSAHVVATQGGGERAGGGDGGDAGADGGAARARAERQAERGDEPTGGRIAPAEPATRPRPDRTLAIPQWSPRTLDDEGGNARAMGRDRPGEPEGA